MGKKLDIPRSVFHRVEDPKHPGQCLYLGVFFIGTKKDPTYYIRYRDKEGKARFEKAGPEANTAALAADVPRNRNGAGKNQMLYARPPRRRRRNHPPHSGNTAMRGLNVRSPRWPIARIEIMPPC